MKSWLNTNTSPTVDRPVAGDDTVAEDAVVFAVDGPRLDEGVELDERSGVEQQIDSLASRQLSAGMLLVDAGLAPAEERFRAHRSQPLDPFLVRRHVGTPPLGSSLRKDSGNDSARRRASDDRDPTDSCKPVQPSDISTELVNNSQTVWITTTLNHSRLE